MSDALVLTSAVHSEAGDPSREIRLGAIIAAAFFVFFLGWAALVPLDAGVHALSAIADFYPFPRRLPEANAQSVLPEEKFDGARRRLKDIGLPVRDDRSKSWSDFARIRARYEPLLVVVGRVTDAPRSEWSPWPDAIPSHVSLVLRSRGGRKEPQAP